ncbi:MAG: CAAX prenyl protease-related protein [Verrucomicrobia bacterium]|nr:CAAX prenyl protease-related protein [Verrucomicrobiota bacterium]
MPSLRQNITASPALIRVLPFGLFLVLTSCQGKFFPGSEFWFYLAKTAVGAWLIWFMRPLVAEMRWRISWEAVAVGIAVFALWVGLDGLYPKLGSAGTPWNPGTQFGHDSPLALLFIATRILGSTLIVPPLEEVFYRSFVYRTLAKPDFQSVPLNYFAWLPFLATAAVFGFSHHEWLAGILCGFAYQGLVLRKNRLGDAITAHAITNLLLGLWVVFKPAWNFW